MTLPAVPTPRIAFQGEPGAFSEEAIGQLWAPAHPVPLRDFADVIAAVQSGAADGGLLPIENTLAGAVHRSYDALAAGVGVHVIGETVLAIHHCLLALPGTTLSDITSAESHPVALAQCTRFFTAHPLIRATVSWDTAGAAREVAQRGDRSIAAIAGRGAAARYGLEVLMAEIEDRPDNQTRFLAIARAPIEMEPGAPVRSRVALTTANEPGALHRVLGPLADRGINLCSLEARPTGEPWAYRFFLELEHLAGDQATRLALTEIGGRAASLRVLGTYPRWP